VYCFVCLWNDFSPYMITSKLKFLFIYLFIFVEVVMSNVVLFLGSKRNLRFGFLIF
jgi:hypothetical protein